MAGFTAMAIFIGAAVAFVVKQGLALSKRTSLAWAAAADRLGGRHDDGGSGGLFRRTREIHAQLDGVDVVVDCYVVSSGSTSSSYTRAYVQGAVASQLGLALLPRGVLRGLTVALGAQDVITGDPRFDDAVIVKGDDEPLVKAWLDEPARQAYLGSVTEGIGTEGGLFRSLRAGVLTDAGELEALARQVAQVAAGGRRLLVRWRKAAEALGGHAEGGGDDWPLRGGVRVVLVHQGHGARVVATRDDHGQSCTQVRLSLARVSQAPFVVGRRTAAPDAGSEPRPWVGEAYEVLSGGGASVWTPQRVTELERLCPARVAREGAEVRVTLDGVEPDPERWRQALDLAARLADDQGGAYR